MVHDAHARPPEHMKALFKKWQKSSLDTVDQSADVLDLSDPPSEADSRFAKIEVQRISLDSQIFKTFLHGSGLQILDDAKIETVQHHVKGLPGLYIYPNLLPPQVQIVLLDKILHRDLANPHHKTNLHLHYHVPYESQAGQGSGSDHGTSFFHMNEDKLLEPKDLTVHKPLTVKQMLERKLRWITLGGQYDWTAKVYPTQKAPRFPDDVRCLLDGIFPDIEAQAAIVNFYTPGDTLSVHRDVSEECDRGLVSISIGCDGIFIIGSEDSSDSISLRLRSGDVVLMSRESRFAWHAVPKILPDTCPGYLHSWPASASNPPSTAWDGWVKCKRININIRQMKE